MLYVLFSICALRGLYTHIYLTHNFSTETLSRLVAIDVDSLLSTCMNMWIHGYMQLVLMAS